MILISIDPGNLESGFVTVETNDFSILYFDKAKNDTLISLLKTNYYDAVAIEWIQNYGARLIGGRVVGGAGQTVFETCREAGRFQQIALDGGATVDLIYRTTIKAHITGKANANDSQVRSCLIDRFGVKGTKANPGKLYGFKSDCFSALALATYWVDNGCLWKRLERA